MDVRRVRQLLGGAGLVVAALLAIGGTYVLVDAACNAVPPAERRYPSTNGLVNRRLVAPWTRPNAQATPGPDDWVEVELPVPCVSGPLFGASVAIEIQFQKPAPGPTASPSWMEIVTDRVVRFTVPDTGRAGPVNVVLTDPTKSTRLAEIGVLYQATSSCNPGLPDETFGRLTVLPPPNEVTALVAGKQPLVMTVDGNGGLLVPLAHPFPVPTADPLGPGALVAFVERGTGDFQALSAPLMTLAQALTAAAKPSDPTLDRQLVRTFTIHGRPLPAVVHVDDRGSVWGSVDAPRSVLRVATADATSNPLQDLAQRLDPAGEIVVTPRPIASPQPFTAATSAPFLLPDLRAGEGVVAWVRDERIEGEFDGQTGHGGTLVETVRAGEAGHGPAFALAQVARDTNGRAPLGTGDLGGAFLEPGSGTKGKLYAYTLKSGGTPIPRRTPADLQSKINKKHALAISNPLVFFGKYQTFAHPKLQTFDLDAGTFQDTGIPAFTESAVGSACSVALASGSTDAWWHCRNKAGSTSGKLGVKGDDIAIAGRLAVVAVPAPTPGVVLRAIRPSASPGPLHRIDQEAAAVGATAYCAASKAACDDALCAGTGERCRPFGVFLAPAPSPSASPGMLYWVAEPAASATPAPVAVQPATDFVARGGIIAFRSPRASGSGKELFTLDLRQNPPRLCSTGSTATAPGAVEWEDAYEIRGNDVLFLTDETEEGKDLDGDLKADRLVLQMFNVEGCSDASFLGTVPSGTSPSIGNVVVSSSVEPRALQVRTAAPTSTLFADEDGDGVVYPFDRCSAVVNPRQIDDDLDGLGDGQQSCDPTYCTPYQPPPVARGSWRARRCRAALRLAARRYLERRADVVGGCLDPGAGTGALAGDEKVRDVICRGTFAALTENRPRVVGSAIVHAEDVQAPPPFDLTPDLSDAVIDLLQAERRVRAIAGDAPCGDPILGAAIVRAEAEAIAAVTRAFTVVGADDRVGRRAATGYVRDAAAIMDDCLDRCRLWPPSAATLARRCLGRIVGKPGAVTFVPPTDRRAAHDLAAARKRLGDTIGRRCAAGTDRDCSEQLACVGWRRAVDVVLASRPASHP